MKSVTRDWSGISPTLHKASNSVAEALHHQFVPTDCAAMMPHRAGKRPTPIKEAFLLEHANKLPNIDGNVLNVRPDPVDFRDEIYQPRLAELPSWLVPDPLANLGLAVRQQGSESSCTGQALAAVIDLQNVKRLRHGADVPARVSARMLYEIARAFDEFPDDGLPGSSARGVIKGFYHRGVCGVGLAPYFDGDMGFRLTPDIAKDARRVTLGSYFRLEHLLNHYHAALVEAGAILCTAMVHDGWLTQSVASAGGRIVLPPDPVKWTGAHAFAIVGYDPDGFFVLNSWGDKWGGLDPRDEYMEHIQRCKLDETKLDTPVFVAGPRPGIAHWSYEDWRRHVLDAWVLRLQVPTRLPSGFFGGFHIVQTRHATAQSMAAEHAARAGAIDGHFIHVEDGRFVETAPYSNNVDTFRQTARLLKQQDNEPDTSKRYDHLLFYAHGGLNEVGTAAARAVAMTPVLKRHGIYPIFYLWHSGLGETAEDLLTRLFQKAVARAGTMLDMRDSILERTIRPFGKPIWNEMKRNAHRNVAGATHTGGPGWHATNILVEAARARNKHPVKVHFVGHSAGAILLGEIFRKAAAAQSALPSLLGTVSLFAPACTTAFYHQALLPAAKTMQPNAFAIYNLSDEAERSDTVAELYGKSLLYLVSNALEESQPEPIVGMDRFRGHLGIGQPEHPTYFLAKGPDAQALPIVGAATSHGSFDNDPGTMNHVLSRIVGKDVDETSGGFTRADLHQHSF